jgi:hypothetical protein
MSNRTLGYAIEEENLESLAENGVEPSRLMAAFREHVPAEVVTSDPLSVVNILNQGSIGSCQGQSLAKAFQVNYFMTTGMVVNFSAMCGYIVAQKFDRLIGRDVGSTLSGGQRVATEHGMCLEADWEYPSRYDARIPAIDFRFKLQSAKPTNDPEEIKEALELGLCVQTGMAWNSELEQERMTKYTGRGAQGGHATLLWHKRGSDYCHLNSWGDWNQDGVSTWSEKALEDVVTHRGNTFVIYGPTGMVYPDVDATQINL